MGSTPPIPEPLWGRISLDVQAALAGDDPEPNRHQIAEVPPVRPVLDEYRPRRLTSGSDHHEGIPMGRRKVVKGPAFW
jgi:hypothetical protein